MKNSSSDINFRSTADDSCLVSSLVSEDIHLINKQFPRPVVLPLVSAAFLALSPVVNTADMEKYQMEPIYQNAITTDISFRVENIVIGKYISHADAVALCRRIMLEAEARRKKLAQYETEIELNFEV